MTNLPTCRAFDQSHENLCWCRLSAERDVLAGVKTVKIDTKAVDLASAVQCVRDLLYHLGASDEEIDRVEGLVREAYKGPAARRRQEALVEC